MHTVIIFSVSLGIALLRPEKLRFLVLERGISDTMGKKESIKIVQQLCPEGVWGLSLRKKVK